MRTPTERTNATQDSRAAATPVPDIPARDPQLQATNLVSNPDNRYRTQPVPERLGRYEVLRQLGAGGMATVYLARDTDLDRLVALKVPHQDARFSPQVLERFQREARAAALLRHPNICPVFDAGRIDDIPYLTMAYIEGRTLAAEAERYRLEGPVAIVDLIRTLAAALAEAHSQGVIHRDLKPSNVMITPEGAPVLMDFGLARRVGRAEDRLTREGLAIGTPAYMPPEQVAGDIDAMGPVSDIYSLGVILYELLTGQLPFNGSVTAVLAQIVHEDPPGPAMVCPGLDRRLDLICRTALAKAPANRYATMPQFAAALQAWRDGAGQVVVALTGEDLEKLAAQALDLLRTWGWTAGLKKMRDLARASVVPGVEQGWHLLMDTLVGRVQPVDGLLQLGVWPDLAGWVCAGSATSALRERRIPAMLTILDQVTSRQTSTDPTLIATLAHLRATAFTQQGRADQALPGLVEALERVGREHFVAGRLLDTLGSIYATQGNFAVARAFYQQALDHKRRHGDDMGRAVTHGQLGRLFLDWGRLDEAEQHFQADLRLAQNLLDARGEAQLLGHLGQVALARGNRDQQAGRQGAARRRAEEAAGWLDSGVRRSVDCGNPVSEGYARKDRALAALLAGDLDIAQAQAGLADGLFRSASHPPGTAQVDRLIGSIRRVQGRYDEATRRLRTALAWFEANGAHAEAARTLWELARSQRADGARPPLLTRTYLDALVQAEASGRPELARAIEEDLREVDPEAHTQHLLSRARGPWVDEMDTTAAEELVTLLALTLDGFADAASEGGPVELLLTLNQTMEAMDHLFRAERMRVLAYQGDGLVAVARDARHAERAVRAAEAAIRLVRERNQPRRILRLPPLTVRLALTTGSVFLGEVGVARHTSLTMLGPAASLLSRLVAIADPDCPLADRATREAARNVTGWEKANRNKSLHGMDGIEVWERKMDEAT